MTRPTQAKGRPGWVIGKSRNSRRADLPTPYDDMWEKLSLDLQAHEGLLAVLGKFYGDIYLTQDKRLKGMEYLDLVLSEVHGLRI